MSKKAIFVVATGQHVGKTTLCLGLFAGLKKRFSLVGFIKPVGQQHVKINDSINVDKDVILFKKYFNLPASWQDMSPLIIPSGFTRDFLDGKVTESEMLQKILSAFKTISEANHYTLVEGTGHVAVGSIINLNNAFVASKLDLDVIIIASGGLGSSFDQLFLNLAVCQHHNINVRGVILNRILEEKREMILNYFPKILKRWKIPLIGLIPYNKLLCQPTIGEFAKLFNTQLLSGQQHLFRHFQHARLIDDTIDIYYKDMAYNELIITPANREDIILANIEKHCEVAQKGRDFFGGMIWTGYMPPSSHIIEKSYQLEIPAFHVPQCSYDVMKAISSFISKISQDDILKIEKAIELVERNIDFEEFIER